LPIITTIVCTILYSANVALMARRTDKLTALKESLEKTHGITVHTIKMDLADKSSVEEASKEIATKFDKVHIVVNNAGMANKSTNAMEADVNAWEECMMVNLVNTMRFTRNVLPLMKTVGSGAIVFISSIAARMTNGGMEDYHASKYGINGFAGSLFEDVRELGIKVSSIMPGFVNTPMANVPAKLDSAKMIQPEDVAASVLYVCKAPDNVCPVEIVLRPQKSPYLK